MTEKSPNPATHWCCPPFYYYTKADAKLVQKGIDSGCGTDAQEVISLGFVSRQLFMLWKCQENAMTLAIWKAMKK